MDPEWAPCDTCTCVGGDAGFERWQIGEQWKSNFCPRQFVTRESRAWLHLWSSYRAGFLLEAGGINDQPAAYLAHMHALESIYAEAICQEKQNST